MNNEKLITKVLELESRIQKLEQVKSTSSIGNSPSAKRAGPSVVEFLISKNPNSEREKVLVFAAFHEVNTGSDGFNIDDILGLWRTAKEKKPANINNLIDQNVKKGLIDENSEKKDNKKSWYLTRSGVEIVEKGFK